MRSAVMEQIPSVLLGAAIAAIATIVGWFVNDRLHHRRSQREATIRKIDTEIEQLFGPLAGKLQHTQHIYRVALAILPCTSPQLSEAKRIDFPRFSEKDWDIWRFLNERYFHPINSEIRNLLSNKSHLIGNNLSEAEIDQFVLHTSHVEARYVLWKEKGIDTSALPAPGYSIGLLQEANAALRRLLLKRDSHLRYLGK